MQILLYQVSGKEIEMIAGEQIQCGKCGGRMTHTTVMTYPPIECYRCEKCGRHIDDTPPLPNPVVIVK